jgi:hypothetical protein
VDLAQSTSEAEEVDLTLAPARWRIHSIPKRFVSGLARTHGLWASRFVPVDQKASTKHHEALLDRPPAAGNTHSGVDGAQSSGHSTLKSCNLSRLEFRCRRRWSTLLEVTAIYAAMMHKVTSRRVWKR